jgi:hypothetical protein
MDALVRTAISGRRPGGGAEFAPDATGNVVTRDVPEAVFAAGNPCRVIRAVMD